MIGPDLANQALLAMDLALHHLVGIEGHQLAKAEKRKRHVGSQLLARKSVQRVEDPLEQAIQRPYWKGLAVSHRGIDLLRGAPEHRGVIALLLNKMTQIFAPCFRSGGLVKLDQGREGVAFQQLRENHQVRLLVFDELDSARGVKTVIHSRSLE